MIELKTSKWRSLAHTEVPAVMAAAMVALIIVIPANEVLRAQTAGGAYPKMAAIDEYLMDADAEAALARSAAPESVSKDAEVMVLDRTGYRTAIQGHNGFVCAVQRSWTAGVDDPEFWNPKLRAPTCFNAAAARSFLPRVIMRTRLVLAGKSIEQLCAEMKAAFDANQIPPIEQGAMAYMLSKQGYLNDRAGHWRPHVMVYVPEREPAWWGANLPGSPVFGTADKTDRVTTFFIPVARWSDGSADPDHNGSH